MMKAVVGLPVQGFEARTVSVVRVDPKSGKLARGSEGTAESFVKGTEPSVYEGD